MPIQHTMGQDLTLSPTGDLATVTGTQAGQERVLRRLLTNPGDYLWHPNYGAGLPLQVGLPADAQRLRALVLGQMQLEDAVSQIPTPTVTVDSDNAGTVVMKVRYSDATTGQAAVLSVPTS